MILYLLIFYYYIYQIEQQFGQEVRNIVQECTDDKNLVKSERKRLQIENTPHKSKKVIMIYILYIDVRSFYEFYYFIGKRSEIG